MNIQVKIIEILENDCGGAGSGDIGFTPGMFSYKSFKKKMRKKKHNESVSATGGNDGALTGGDVYNIGVDMGTKPTPRSTGDLILSPISTEPDNSTGAYGVPVKALKHKKEPISVDSKKDGKKMRVLNWDGYIRAKMNTITRLKK